LNISFDLALAELRKLAGDSATTFSTQLLSPVNLEQFKADIRYYAVDVLGWEVGEEEAPKVEAEELSADTTTQPTTAVGLTAGSVILIDDAPPLDFQPA
jgi:hypothetical protein